MDAKKTGALIREIRTEQGMTQKDLAAKLHVSEAAVSKWETGKGFPDVVILETLADVLGISMTSILKGDRESAEENSEVLKDVVKLSGERDKKRKSSIRVYRLIIGILVLGIAGLVIITAASSSVKPGIKPSVQLDSARIDLCLPEGWDKNEPLIDFTAEKVYRYAQASGEAHMFVTDVRNRLRIVGWDDFTDTEEMVFRIYRQKTGDEKTYEDKTVLANTNTVRETTLQGNKALMMRRDLADQRSGIVYTEEEYLIHAGNAYVVIGFIGQKERAQDQKEFTFIRKNWKIVPVDSPDQWARTMNIQVKPGENVSLDFETGKKYAVYTDADCHLRFAVKQFHGINEENPVYISEIPVYLQGGRYTEIALLWNSALHRADTYVYDEQGLIAGSLSKTFDVIITGESVRWLEDDTGNESIAIDRNGKRFLPIMEAGEETGDGIRIELVFEPRG